MRTNSQNEDVTIRALALEISYAAVDRFQPHLKEAEDTAVRRELEVSFSAHGWHDTPGVMPLINRMTEKGEICPRCPSNGFPPVSVDQISDEWLLDPADQAKVRAALLPKRRNVANPYWPLSKVILWISARNVSVLDRFDELLSRGRGQAGMIEAIAIVAEENLDWSIAPGEFVAKAAQGDIEVLGIASVTEGRQPIPPRAFADIRIAEPNSLVYSAGRGCGEIGFTDCSVLGSAVMTLWPPQKCGSAINHVMQAEARARLAHGLRRRSIPEVSPVTSKVGLKMPAPSRRSPVVTPAGYVPLLDAISRGVNQGAQAGDRFSDTARRRGNFSEHLRQLLETGQLSAVMSLTDGELHPISPEYWRSDDVRRALQDGTAKEPYLFSTRHDRRTIFLANADVGRVLTMAVRLDGYDPDHAAGISSPIQFATVPRGSAFAGDDRIHWTGALQLVSKHPAVMRSNERYEEFFDGLGKLSPEQAAEAINTGPAPLLIRPFRFLSEAAAAGRLRVFDSRGQSPINPTLFGAWPDPIYVPPDVAKALKHAYVLQTELGTVLAKVFADETHDAAGVEAKGIVQPHQHELGGPKPENPVRRCVALTNRHREAYRKRISENGGQRQTFEQDLAWGKELNLSRDSVRELRSDHASATDRKGGRRKGGINLAA